LCFRTVDCLYDGIVEKTLVNEGAFVYEWESLFQITTPNGITKEVKIGVSGFISKVNVTRGDRVISNMTLAILEEDTFPTGCD
jgi:pyruvate/2-oxoglutarate dehydrogenase complex dihydrolipoamide acyltransferase (E2) component